MNKKNYVILAIFLISILIIISRELIFNKSILIENKNEISHIVKNDSWWTYSDSETPYKIWDEIEHIFVIYKDQKTKANIDISNIEKEVNIKELSIDWKNIKKDDLKNILIDKNSILKIKWIAKIWSEDSKADIVVKDLEKLKDYVFTWSVSTWTLSFEIKNNNFNSNINNIIEITWKWLDQVDYVNIWWVSFVWKYENNNLYLLIDKWTFSTWDFFLIFKLKNWNIITSTKKVSFYYSVDKVNISNITPKIIKNDIDRYIVVQWNWFSKIVSIQLNNNIILKSTEYTIINDNVLSIKIPKWLNPWEYSINIMDTSNIYQINYIKFNITN